MFNFAKTLGQKNSIEAFNASVAFNAQNGRVSQLVRDIAALSGIIIPAPKKQFDAWSTAALQGSSLTGAPIGKARAILQACAAIREGMSLPVIIAAEWVNPVAKPKAAKPKTDPLVKALEMVLQAFAANTLTGEQLQALQALFEPVTA